MAFLILYYITLLRMLYGQLTTTSLSQISASALRTPLLISTINANQIPLNVTRIYVATATTRLLLIQLASRHIIAILCPPINSRAYRFSSLSSRSRSMSSCSSSTISRAAASSTGSAHIHPIMQSSRRSRRGMRSGCSILSHYEGERRAVVAEGS